MAHRPLVCVGSGDTAGDIQVFDVRDGAGLELLSVIGTGHGVSYISVHPSGDVVYVIYSHEDKLSAFGVDRAAGCLRLLDEVATGSAMGPPGSGACYATVDATGRVGATMLSDSSTARRAGSAAAMRREWNACDTGKRVA